MAGPATILREIHRLRRHAKDLQTEIERQPRLLKAQQSKIARQEELLREAQDKLKHLKVATHEKEVQLRSTHQQIAKHQKQLNEAASKKEYDALQTEINNDRQACKRLEDEILEGLAETDERAAQIPELEQSVKRAREEAAQFEKESQARQASLREMLDQAVRQLKEVEGTIPDAVRPQYERLVAARDEQAMAAVENRTCSACYTEITAQNYNELLIGQFVLCKSCGRILYLRD
jgi:predicted  nucleic acid-binding Zn-ribbon protein